MNTKTLGPTNFIALCKSYRNIYACIPPKICIEMFRAAPLIIVLTWERAKCPPTEWISKQWQIHTMKIPYSSEGNKPSLYETTWKNSSNLFMLSKRIQIPRSIYCIISLCKVLKQVILICIVLGTTLLRKGGGIQGNNLLNHMACILLCMHIRVQ